MSKLATVTPTWLSSVTLPRMSLRAAYAVQLRAAQAYSPLIIELLNLTLMKVLAAGEGRSAKAEVVGFSTAAVRTPHTTLALIQTLTLTLNPQSQEPGWHQCSNATG